MKKTILNYGLISGTIVTATLIVTSILWKNNPDFEPSPIMGFGSMLLAFIFIFIGIKRFRDNHNNGTISFGKAFKIGALIALIASAMYVIAWMISLNFYFPNFIERYSELVMRQANVSGKSAIEIQMQTKEIQWMKNAYKNPIYVILLTFMEILPLGLLVALVSSLILKKQIKH